MAGLEMIANLARCVFALRETEEGVFALGMKDNPPQLVDIII